MQQAPAPAAAGLPLAGTPAGVAATTPAPAPAPAAAAAATPPSASRVSVAAQAPSAPSAAAPPAAEPAGDPRFAKCGFAKLLGDNGLEYYLKKYEAVMGRRSKTPVDVVLGDSPVLSRHHARILYNFAAKQWELHVEGKNGVTVNGTLHTPASGPCVLQSQDLLQAGDHNFYFLLPKQPRKRAPAKPKAAAAGMPAASEGQGQGQGLAAAAAAAGATATPQQQQQLHLQQQQAQSPRLGQPAALQQQLGQQLPLLPGLGAPAAAGALLPPLPAAPAGSEAAAAAAAAPPGGFRSYSGPLLPGMSPMHGVEIGNSSTGDQDALLLLQQPQFRVQGSLGSFGDGSGMLYGSGLLAPGVPSGLGEFDVSEEDPNQPLGMED